jgi:serine O-acetyltransferase
MALLSEKNYILLNGGRDRREVTHLRLGPERLHQRAHKLWIAGHKKASRAVRYLSTLLYRSYIHPAARIGARLHLGHHGFGVVVHPDTVIGDDVALFHGVTIGDGGARIGDRVRIGAGAVIIGNVRIGNDATIGANVVCTHDVPANATLVGPKPHLLGR